MKQDFFGFFLPTSILNRKAAARAVAAGSFVSFILAVSAGIATAMLFAKDGSNQRIPLFLGATSVLVAVTIGTWKRMLSASILGLLLSVIVLVWQIRSGRIATAIVLAIPLIGGFSAAIRGIVALKSLKRSDAAKRSV